MERYIDIHPHLSQRMPKYVDKRMTNPHLGELGEIHLRQQQIKGTGSLYAIK